MLRYTKLNIRENIIPYTEVWNATFMPDSNGPTLSEMV